MKKVITAALAALLCLSAGAAAFLLAGRVQRSRIYGKLKDAAPYTDAADFEALRSVDPEIFAWISIPGTEVEYPVAKHPSDDGYYLTHTVEGLSGAPGSIFAFGYTAEDFSQFNTVLYGRELRFGGMFSSLGEYRDPDYLAAHRLIRISTPDAVYEYEVIACVRYDDRLIDTGFDQRDPADRRAYLASVQAAAAGTAEPALEAVDVLNDRLLTLEAIGGEADGRTLVLAVRKDGR